MLFVGARVKKNRYCWGEELTQESEFVFYYNLFTEKCAESSPVSPFEIQNFDQKLVKRGNEQYVENLRKFNGHRSSILYG